MHVMVTAAYYVLKQLGKDDWTVGIVRLPDQLIQVRHQRKFVAISSEFAASCDVETLAEQLALQLSQSDDHPGWEAACICCNRRFFRSKPAAAEHQCAECRLPLEFE